MVSSVGAAAAAAAPAAGIRVVVCDIEGTTTSISFVKDTLFPYVLQNVRAHLTATWSEPATVAVVQLLRTEAAADVAAQLDGAVPVPAADADSAEQIEALVRVVEWQMAADRKATPLKQLQGQIWALAYESGAIKGHVYDDVPKAMDAWLTAGARVCIYSSGSVAAQKLLFGHSVHGDMQPRLSGHYDTKIGAKQQAASYAAIVADLAVSAAQVLFLTDIVGEAKAAKEAGMRAVLVERPGNAPLSDAERLEYTVVQTFADVSLETALKRKMDADEEPVDAATDGVAAEVEVRPTKVAKTDGGDADVTVASSIPEPLQTESATSPDDASAKPAVDSSEGNGNGVTDVAPEVSATNGVDSTDAVKVETVDETAAADDAMETDVVAEPEVKTVESVAKETPAMIETDTTATAPEPAAEMPVEVAENDKTEAEVIEPKEAIAEQSTTTVEAVEEKKEETKAEDAMEVDTAEVVETGATDSVPIVDEIEIVADEIAAEAPAITEEKEAVVAVTTEIAVAATDIAPVETIDVVDKAVVELPVVVLADASEVVQEVVKNEITDTEMSVAEAEPEAVESNGTVATNISADEPQSNGQIAEQTPEVPVLPVTHSEPPVDKQPATPEEKPTAEQQPATPDEKPTADVAMDTEIVATNGVTTSDLSASETADTDIPNTPKADAEMPIPVTIEHTKTTTTTTADDTPTTANSPDIGMDTTKETTSTTTTTTTTEVSTGDSPIAGVVDKAEKVSRVEITIEQTEKMSGQTTQTTTHIVKEICIKEQVVVGNNSSSTTTTTNIAEAATNTDATIVGSSLVSQPSEAADVAAAAPATESVACGPDTSELVSAEIKSVQNGTAEPDTEMSEEPPAADAQVADADASNGEAAQKNGTTEATVVAVADAPLVAEAVVESPSSTVLVATAVATNTPVEEKKVMAAVKVTATAVAAKEAEEEAEKSGNDSDKENDVSSTNNGAADADEAATTAAAGDVVPTKKCLEATKPVTVLALAEPPSAAAAAVVVTEVITA